MGLDSIELLVRVEKTFGIKIPDEEAEQIITVGQLQDSVWKHLDAKQSVHCTSQFLFYKLRQELEARFQHAKLHPAMLMNNIFPQQNRRRAFREFGAAVNMQLPPLKLTRPWWIVLNALGFTAILGTFIVALVLVNFYNYSGWIFLIPFFGIFLTEAISKILTPFRTVIDPATLRQFTENVLALNYGAIAKQTGANRAEVDSVIKHLIADQTGVELEEITPDARFGADLGMD